MANKQAAMKAVRRNKKLTAKNLQTSAQIEVLKTQIRKAVAANKLDDAKKLLAQLQQRVDKALKTGFLKGSINGRIKSRMASLVSKKK